MFFGSRRINIFIQKYFSGQCEQIYQFSQGKQQKGIQLPYIFLKFYMNQFSNQFLLFLDFPAL